MGGKGGGGEARGGGRDGPSVATCTAFPRGGRGVSRGRHARGGACDFDTGISRMQKEPPPPQNLRDSPQVPRPLEA